MENEKTSTLYDFVLAIKEKRDSNGDDASELNAILDALEDNVGDPIVRARTTPGSYEIRAGGRTLALRLKAGGEPARTRGERLRFGPISELGERAVRISDSRYFGGLRYGVRLDNGEIGLATDERPNGTRSIFFYERGDLLGDRGAEYVIGAYTTTPNGFEVDGRWELL